MEIQLKKLRTIIVVCIVSLLAISKSFGQNIDGYWHLVKVETEEWDNILENRRTYISGEPGDLTYNNELGRGNNVTYYRATGRYDIPPEKLIPNREYNINYSFKVTAHSPPGHHWNPGTQMNIWDYNLYKDGEKPRGRERYFVGSVSALGDTGPHKGTATIIPPDYDGSDKTYFKIRFFIGAAKPGAGVYYHYIYEWRTVKPSTIIDETPESKPTGGYWHFTELKTEEWDNILENRRTYISGEPGDLTYNNELGRGNNVTYYRATGRYDIPPEKLIPNREYNINYSFKVTAHSPPGHHWNPGTQMNIWDYNPYKDGEKPRGRERYFVGSVSALGDTGLHKGTATIIPPEYDGSDKTYFKIRFFIGAAKPGAGVYYHYIYEWRNATH